jgi:5-methylcytosine-specific restriction enzyme subunit McrC
MTLRETPLAPLREWHYLKIADEPLVDAVTEYEAEALLQAAAAHPLATDGGTNILVRYPGRKLRAQQMVGVIAAGGVVLEILPKVDPDLGDAPGETAASLRTRLVDMLGVALDINLSAGADAAIARQQTTLLDILIRLFADRLLAETRRGLPRAYVGHAEDLPKLRGRLDVVRQFTVHAVRPDRLACRYDELTSDTALMQVVKAAVVFLEGFAREGETLRRLSELRLVLADVGDVPRGTLPWEQVKIDRTNRRWETLYTLARLFLLRDWQATHHEAATPEGIALLFPMNELFEAYVGALLRRGLAHRSDVDVVLQGGRRNCLGDWFEGTKCHGAAFQTIPDILLRCRNSRQTLGIIDTKWKRLATTEVGAKKGVQQGDVYQMMAYSRVYWPPSYEESGPARLMLLYPTSPGEVGGIAHDFGIHGGHERLSVARVDLAAAPDEKSATTQSRLAGALAEIALELIGKQRARDVIAA